MMKKILGLMLFFVGGLAAMLVLPHATSHKGVSVFLLKESTGSYGAITQAEFTKLGGAALTGGAGSNRIGNITSGPLGAIKSKGWPSKGVIHLAWVEEKELKTAILMQQPTVQQYDVTPIKNLSINPTELKKFFPELETKTPTGKLHVISLNVLFQEPYENWLGKNSKGAYTPIALADRVESFKYIIREWPAIDIYCFQEYSFSSKSTIQKQWDQINSFLISDGFDLSTKFEQSPGRYGLLTAFKSNKFTKIGVDQSAQLGADKGYLITILQHKDTKKKIGIINCHLQGFLKSKEDLKTIQKKQITLDAQADAWILCGDFNTPDGDTYFKEVFHLTSDEWKEANSGKKITARSGSDQEVRYDYMFYKGFENLDDFAVRPKDPVVLLSHKVQQVIGDTKKAQKNYTFWGSDHAYLHAVYSLATGEVPATTTTGVGYPGKERGDGEYTELPTGPQPAYPEDKKYTFHYSFDTTGKLVFLMRGTSSNFIPFLPHVESDLNTLENFSDAVTDGLGSIAQAKTTNLKSACYKYKSAPIGYVWVDAQALYSEFDNAMYSATSSVDIEQGAGSLTAEVISKIIDTESKRPSSKKPIHTPGPETKDATKELQAALQALRDRLSDLAGALLGKPTSDVYITLVEFQLIDLKYKNPLQAAVVNAANSGLTTGGNVAGVIFDGANRESGGEEKLKAQCQAFTGSPKCPTGQAKITESFGIRLGYQKAPVSGGKFVPDNLGAHYVIHAVGPTGEDASALRSAYQESLKVADNPNNPSFKTPLLSAKVLPNITQIAFPSISTAIYGYTLDKATSVAIQAILDYFKSNPASKISEIYLIAYPLQLMGQNTVTKECSNDTKIITGWKATGQYDKKYAYYFYQEELDKMVKSGRLVKVTSSWDPVREESFLKDMKKSAMRPLLCYKFVK